MYLAIVLVIRHLERGQQNRVPREALGETVSSLSCFWDYLGFAGTLVLFYSIGRYWNVMKKEVSPPSRSNVMSTTRQEVTGGLIVIARTQTIS